MDTINRCALIVKPGKPFLDWLHEVDSTSVHLTVADLQQEPTIYLVPECDNEEQAIAYLWDSMTDIFEDHLDGWYRVPGAWPKNRDRQTFMRWFEVTFHSMIVDLCDGVFEREEM